MLNGKHINDILQHIPLSSEVIGYPRFQAQMKDYIKKNPSTCFHYYSSETSLSAGNQLPVIFQGFNASKTFEVFSVLMKNARVWGRNGCVVSCDDHLITDVSREFNAGTGLHHSIFYTIRQKKVVPLKGMSAVIGTAGSGIYYHWMMDILPRLGLLERATSLEQIDHFITGFEETGFQNESLELIGIDRSKLVASNDNWNFHIKATELWVPSLSGFLDQPNSFQVNYLRNLFRKHISPEQPFRKIYVSREKTGRRYIENEKEFLQSLRIMDFEIVQCEELNLTEQIRLFSEAAFIVGSHGSAFTNLVFCHEKTRVLEIFNESHINPCFWLISSIRKLEYDYIRGKSIAIDKNPKNDNTKIDSKLLLSRIESLNAQ